MSEPCKGEGTCCNRELCDRVIFPCTPEQQMDSFRRQVMEGLMELGRSLRSVKEDIDSITDRLQQVEQRMAAMRDT